MGKRITILFPDAGDKPVGGHKILLQYANEFAKLNYQINIVYSCYYVIPVKYWHKILRLFKRAFIFISTKIRKTYSSRTWFELNPSIKEFYVWSLYSSRIPDADYYFATAAVTAKSLGRFTAPSKNKFYFIQGYEPWLIGDAGLIETYKLEYPKIVVSCWLKTLVGKYSEPPVVVPNGFNQSEFRLTNPIEKRTPSLVSILYHNLASKGFLVGLKALELVKCEIPELKVLAFGAYSKPSYMPDWFDYYQNPDVETHNHINNEASIYLGTSFMEGFGLTIGEAMMCGQAVVCTNNDGYMEMAIPDVNSLVCPVGDYHALANAIIRLIKNHNLRISLAKNGNRTIQEFTIDKSVAKIRSLLT